MILDEAVASMAPHSQTMLHRPARALVVSGSYGAGHDAAAREIQTRLLQAGWRADVVDIADLYPLGLGRLLRTAYFKQLQLAPGTWGTLLRALEFRSRKHSAGRQRACGLSGRLPAKQVAAAVGPETGLVISTHPFASQALGFLRLQGLLEVPAITYLTDASVHPFWIHGSIETHIAVHDEAARQARSLGARGVEVIEPLTPQVAAPHGRERDTLRSVLGLAPSTRIALISSGSEGAGDVRASARDVREGGVATPVVLCGRNERLRRKLERDPGVVAIGWIDGLTDVIRGSDCLIQNSGGFTTLEALALGTPLISYRCLAGHGQASAAALRREGLAPWPQNVSDLGSAIEGAAASRQLPVTRYWAERASLLSVLPLSSPVKLAG